MRCFFITIIIICLVPFKTHSENKIILFGDSLMSGYGVEKQFHLSKILEKSLFKKGYKFKVINASVPGDTSFGGLNRIQWTLSHKNIEILILALGANDMLRGIVPEETKKNIEKIINIVLNKNIKIILAGMIAPYTYGQDYKKKFDKIYQLLSIKYKLNFIPFLLENVALQPSLNLNDGIHPNKHGIKIIGKTLEKKIILSIE